MNRARFEVLPALSALALAVAICLAVAAGARALSRQWLTLSGAELRAEGVDAQTVERAAAALRKFAGASVLDLNPDEVRRELEDLPGTAEAHVRRRARTLTAELHPRLPLARWADGGLVSARGARYAGDASARLPIFSGAESRTAEMAEFYGSAREILAERGMAPAQLELSESGDWRVVLENGVAVYLGREAPRARLRRFAKHYAAAAELYARVDSADVRYARGFALRGELKGDEEEEGGGDSNSELDSVLDSDSESALGFDSEFDSESDSDSDSVSESESESESVSDFNSDSEFEFDSDSDSEFDSGSGEDDVSFAYKEKQQ